MLRWVILAAAILAAAAGARADEHERMRAARHELKIAKEHLQVAPSDDRYAGHRKAALDLVTEAIAEVNRGLKAAESGQQP